MRCFRLSLVIAVVSSALTWSFTTALNTKSDQIQDLTRQISVLTVQVDAMHSSLASSPTTDSNNQLSNAGVDKILNQTDSSQPVWISDASENQSVEQVMEQTKTIGPPNADNSLATRPGMIMVNPTFEQNETYEVLKAQLEDPYFISTLNISDLANSPELQTLPEVMRLSILSKAISKFNNGEVSRDTFMNIAQ